jgi:hypothetical protein
MPSLIEELRSYQSRRRFPDWQPKPSAVKFTGDKTSPSYQVLLRCLDFLPLELQVAEWDKEACCDIELADVYTAILERNAADETKHDEVLGYLADYLGKYEAPVNYQDVLDCNELVRRWQKLDCHPLVAMYALEIGVFYSILPTLLRSGDVYAATVAQWISDDEVVHVNTGLRLMKALGLKLTKEVLELVRDTNVYIFAPLGTEEAVERANRAVKRTATGEDKQMLEESLPTTIAFFEQKDKRSIVY